MSDFLPGVHAAPNIQTAPDLYEIENRAADPEQRIEAALRSIAGCKNRLCWILGDGVSATLSRPRPM
ncbi:MAG: hypothetical protein IPK17_10990 [Chloroflexi bacterium]|uniref:hypothetical protein n=1 Tax=Candidatus Flexifilum breve TaxID=3140694 RepID=UPI003136E085|nr:hypothetical protein [Chloroflexota bacterium]